MFDGCAARKVWRGPPLYEFFDHTGDIGVRLASPTLTGLYEAAVEALSESLTDPETVDPKEGVTLRLGPAPPDLLLADLLGELVFLFETRSFLPRRARVTLTGTDEAPVLEAVVEGETLDPRRHGVKVLIKAVTLHRLDVARGDDGWRGAAVLDI